MQLSSTGISCHPNLPQIGFPATDNGEIIRARSRHSGLPQARHLPSADLYFTARPASTGPAATTSRKVTLAQAAVRRSSPTQWTETHHSNLQQKLLRRLEVAKAKGDDQLVSLLEQEMRQLALV